MKCPHCKETFEKIKIIEGKYAIESVDDTKLEKRHAKMVSVFLCPKCETILSINNVF